MSVSARSKDRTSLRSCLLEPAAACLIGDTSGPPPDLANLADFAIVKAKNLDQPQPTLDTTANQSRDRGLCKSTTSPGLLSIQTIALVFSSSNIMSS